MIRVLGGRSVWLTTNRRPAADAPSTRWRSSLSEWSGGAHQHRQRVREKDRRLIEGHAVLAVVSCRLVRIPLELVTHVTEP